MNRTNTLDKDVKVSTSSSTWNFTHLFLAWMVGILLQSIFLPCLCYEGTIKMYVALMFDLAVVLRGLVAWLLKEKNNTWIMYVVLCYSSFIWIDLLYRVSQAFL